MSKKTILVTGATDGIGLETSKRLVALGHRVLLHGRSVKKLQAVTESLPSTATNANSDTYAADFSRVREVEQLARSVAANHPKLDVLINNAGVFMTSDPVGPNGLDLRFVVNTIAPYLLTKRLLPTIRTDGRVINLSSAAQSPVDLEALAGKRRLTDGEAYAQSKLAITMWSRDLSETIGSEGPAIIAVNPASFLGSKMVKEAYGLAGKNLGIGADVLTRAALDEEFATASGQYFDNDCGCFTTPHPDALDDAKCNEIVQAIETVLADGDT